MFNQCSNNFFELWANWIIITVKFDCMKYFYYICFWRDGKFRDWLPPFRFRCWSLLLIKRRLKILNIKNFTLRNFKISDFSSWKTTWLFLKAIIKKLVITFLRTLRTSFVDTQQISNILMIFINDVSRLNSPDVKPTYL